jgi:hypothetical protein
LAFNDGAGTEFQPWPNVSAPSELNRLMNGHPVPAHVSQPRPAQTPSSKALTTANDCAFQNL